jgi:hypothetical protein
MCKGKAVLREHFDGYSDLRWHEVYWALSGQYHETYIPEDIFYTVIEPKLNPKTSAAVLADKTFLYSLPLAAHLPRAVLHVKKGIVFDANFMHVSDNNVANIIGDFRGQTLVCKPTGGTGGGRDVQILDASRVLKYVQSMISNPEKRKRYNLLVQQAVQQSRETARLNPSSVNTLRIVTFRTHSGIVNISSTFRVGRYGSALITLR